MKYGPLLPLGVVFGVYLSCAQAQGQDPDTDGDGLPDYQEIRCHGPVPYTALTLSDQLGAHGNVPNPR